MAKTKAAPKLVRTYYPDGTLKSVGRLAGKKKVGPWRIYHRDGKLWSSGRYQENGVATGLWKWFAANGTLRQVGRFDEKGRLTGTWKRYYGGTGKLYDVGRWDAGKKVGVWRVYAKGGRVKKETKHGAQRR